MTTAMIIAQRGKIPSKYWQHDKYLQDYKGFTVEYYLLYNNKEVPEQWKIEDKQIEMTNEIQQKLKEFCRQGHINNQQLLIKYPQCKRYQKTFAIHLAQKGIIPPEYFNYNPRLKYYRQTVQEYLEQNGKQVPKYWKIQQINRYCYEYNSYEDTIINYPQWQNNMYRYTFAMYLAQKGVIPPEQFNHNPALQDRKGYTVEDYLIQSNIDVPDYWKTKQFSDSVIKCLNKYCKKYNVNKQTVIDNPKYQKQYDSDTFAIYLEMNGITIPKEFLYDPLYILKNDITTAMKIAEKGKVPSNYWQHDPCLINSQNQKTVAMYLSEKGIIPPKEWEHDPTIQNDNGNTVAVYLEINNIQIPKQWQYDPEYRLKDNQTTAMKIVSYNKIPSQQWYHDPSLVDKQGKTVEYHFLINNKKVPNQWKCEDKYIEINDEIQKYLNEYCKENYIKNQQIIINYPQYQKDKWDDTFAVYLESKGIITPKEFQYDPEYILKYNSTTAMQIASKGRIPSEHWYHDPNIQNKCGFTVSMYLAQNGIIPPQEWNHNPTIQNKWGYTVAMYLSQNKIFNIPKQWEHNPTIQNEEEITIAMICAYQGITPPQQWNHDKDIKDKYGFTVQDYLQGNNMEVPDEWRTINCGVQDKTIIKYLSDYCKEYNINKDIIINNPKWQNNIYKETFAMYLSSKGIIPPQQWMHDINIKNNLRKSIKSNLISKGYKYINNEFIKLTQDNINQFIQTELLDDTCQICLQEGQQYFIKSTCTHKVCINCFLEMIKVKTYKNCPICRQHNWFQYQTYLNIQDEYSNTDTTTTEYSNSDTTNDTTDNESYEQSNTTTTDYNSSIQSNTTDYEYSTISQ